ncbi:MAG: TniB family NTP-binding protein [Kangiella sp.]|nr:TniB family NTP-binding protein [Kangiella sp.]
MKLEQLKNLEKFAVPHRRFIAAKKGIEDAVVLSQATGRAENVVLVGPAGTGKTRVCRSITQKFKPSIERSEMFESTLIPAFYSCIPSPATVKGAAVNMLQSLGVNDAHRGNTSDIQHRLGVLLKNCKTKVILLDELQHLLRPNSSNVNVRDWIKHLINEFQIPIVAIGTPDCEALIDSDEQLSRRFVRRFSLANFNSPLHDNEFGSYLMAMVKIIHKTIDIEVKFDIKQPKNLLAIYAATGGNPSGIEQLFKDALATCLISNQQELTTDSIAQSAARLILPYRLCGGVEAFTHELEELQTIILDHKVTQ